MQAWDTFVEAQTAELGAETVQKWLKSLVVARFDACNLHLEAKDAFQVMWFEEHIRQKVQSKLFNGNGKRIKVHLSVSDGALKPKAKSKKAKAAPEAVKPAFSLNFDSLDPHSTFSTYVASDANLFTQRVLAQLVDTDADGGQSATIFNPVYIHGGAGYGKTHLLMATAHVLQQQGRRVIYSRAQTFTDHVITAIRAGEMSVFRRSYRNSDVLIIDDVHMFSRKGATQEEFFHTFNALHVAGKQIILSANCAPGDLQFVEPRLVSRFEWGIVLPLEPLSRDEARKMLLQKAELMQFALHAKVVDFLLESFSGCKSLCRAFEALVLRCHLNRNTAKSSSSHVTVPLAKQLLADLLLEEAKSAVTPTRIVAASAEFFGICPDDVLGKAQTRDCVLPRQLSMFLCRQQLKMPYTKIGELFSKDHSTVMSSVKLVQQKVDGEDPEIAHAYRSILKKIQE